MGALAVTLSKHAFAQNVAVPIRVQAELLSKVIIYDRNFNARAGDLARVLIVAKAGDPDSSLAATEMKTALSSIPTIGALPHEEEVVTYTDAPALVETCKSRKIAALYLTPGFAKQIDAIRDAIASLDLLSVGSIADYIPNGIVLGFDLVSGKPKLLVNLSQARKQHVEFKAEVLRLMKVYE